MNNIKETDSLTVKQGYLSMYAFLQNIYFQTKLDDLGGFLGGMSLLGDGLPADRAAWEDWCVAIEEVNSLENNLISGNEIENLSIKQAYLAMIAFLEASYKRISSDEFSGYLRGMKLLENAKTSDPLMWNKWLEAVNAVFGDKDGLIGLFQWADE